MADLYLRF